MSTGKLYIYIYIHIYIESILETSIFDHRNERRRKRKSNSKNFILKITLTSVIIGIHDYLVAHFRSKFHTKSFVSTKSSSHSYVPYIYSCHLTFYISKSLLSCKYRTNSRLVTIFRIIINKFRGQARDRDRGREGKLDFRLHGVQVEAELTRVSANKGDHFESVR